MADIKVNKIIWDAVSDSEKQHIAAHLRQYGVLKSDQNIIADPDTPLPDITLHHDDARIEDVENVKALGVDWICRSVCDSTKAETDCLLYGQSLSACLATVSASREAYLQSANNAEFYIRDGRISRGICPSAIHLR